jgi:hypothetical protein
LNDPDLARQLGRRGQAAVYDRYSDAAMAQRMLELYGGLGARDSTKDEKQLSKE